MNSIFSWSGNELGNPTGTDASRWPRRWNQCLHSICMECRYVSLSAHLYKTTNHKKVTLKKNIQTRDYAIHVLDPMYLVVWKKKNSSLEDIYYFPCFFLFSLDCIKAGRNIKISCSIHSTVPSLWTGVWKTTNSFNPSFLSLRYCHHWNCRFRPFSFFDWTMRINWRYKRLIKSITRTVTLWPRWPLVGVGHSHLNCSTSSVDTRFKFWKMLQPRLSF